jgi:uncharacterized protein (TIGR03000 family)
MKPGISVAIRTITAAAAFFLGAGFAAAQTAGASGSIRYTVPYYEQPGSPVVVRITRAPAPAAPAAAVPAAAAPAGPAYGAAAQNGEREPAYYTENYTGPVEEEGPAAKIAQIRVRLPAAAELWIDDYKAKQTGAVREFVTPELDPERVYTLRLHARWLEDGITVDKSLKVKAIAGTRVTVNFIRPAAPARPRPVVRSGGPAPSYAIQQDVLRWIPGYP